MIGIKTFIKTNLRSSTDLPDFMRDYPAGGVMFDLLMNDGKLQPFEYGNWEWTTSKGDDIDFRTIQNLADRGFIVYTGDWREPEFTILIEPNFNDYLWSNTVEFTITPVIEEIGKVHWYIDDIKVVHQGFTDPFFNWVVTSLGLQNAIDKLKRSLISRWMNPK